MFGKHRHQLTNEELQEKADDFDREQAKIDARAAEEDARHDYVTDSSTGIRFRRQ